MKKSTILITLGLLLCAAALGIFVHKSAEKRRAEDELNGVLAELAPIVADAVANAPQPLSKEDMAAMTRHTEVPDYQLNPLMELPALDIGGESYVGILSVPSCELELPVLRETGEAALPSQPCVYSGTPYRKHFAVSAVSPSVDASAIRLGSSLIFTDMDGNRFSYAVVELLQLSSPVDAPQEWDLTVYISSGRKGIIAVGCEKETPN